MTTQGYLLALGRSMLGDDLDIVGWHHGHRDLPVLHARTAEHGEVIVKIHRSHMRHQQEIHAYQHWAPILGDRVPRLIAVNLDPPAIAITAIAGALVTHAILTHEEQHDVFRQAGAILRDFHQASPPKQDPTWRAFLAGRGEHWLTRAGERIASATREQLHARLQSLIRLPESPLTPCHLDFSPRNLIYGLDGVIRVIDFEHARYDLPARDLVRLSNRIWKPRPDLRDAFLSAYGPLTELDQQIIECCAAIDEASLMATNTLDGT